MERADEELEKVNAFYTGQEAELLARGDALLEQLRILADVKRILADHAAARRARGLARSRSMPPRAAAVLLAAVVGARLQRPLPPLRPLLAAVHVR